MTQPHHKDTKRTKINYIMDNSALIGWPNNKLCPVIRNATQSSLIKCPGHWVTSHYGDNYSDGEMVLGRSSQRGGRPSVGRWREWSNRGGRRVCWALLPSQPALPKRGHETITRHTPDHRWQKQRTPTHHSTKRNTKTRRQLFGTHLPRTGLWNNRHVGHITTEPFNHYSYFLIIAQPNCLPPSSILCRHAHIPFTQSLPALLTRFIHSFTRSWIHSPPPSLSCALVPQCVTHPLISSLPLYFSWKRKKTPHSFPLPSLPSLFSLIHSLFAHPHVKNTRYKKKKTPKKTKQKNTNSHQVPVKTQVETQRQSHWHFTSLDSTSIFIMYIIYRICFTNKQVRFWRWMGIMLFGQWTLHCSIISQCSLDCRGPSSLTNCLASLAPLPVTWMRTEMWLLSHTKKKIMSTN